MNFKTLLLCLTLTAVLLTGCQGNRPSDGESAPGQPPAETATEPAQGSSEQSTPEPSAGSETVFQAGTWLGTREDGSQQYYFFSDGGASGQTVSLETGMGLGFACEYADGRAVFHMGEMDNQTPSTVQVTDAEHLTLQWENDSTETLVYVSPLGADEFTFYSNDELCDMALAYYRQTSGSDSPDLTAGAAGNEDGTVTIQIYENLDGHNSTAAWYTVDRFTGQGTDVNTGEAVDLTLSAR